MRKKKRKNTDALDETELLAGWDDCGMVMIRAGSWGWCWISVLRRLYGEELRLT